MLRRLLITGTTHHFYHWMVQSGPAMFRHLFELLPVIQLIDTVDALRNAPAHCGNGSCIKGRLLIRSILYVTRKKLVLVLREIWG